LAVALAFSPAAEARKKSEKKPKKKPAAGAPAKPVEIPEVPEEYRDPRAPEIPETQNPQAAEDLEALKEMHEESEIRESGGGTDGNPPARGTSTRRAYCAVGPAMMGNLNTGGVGFAFAGAYAWNTYRGLAKLQAQFEFNGRANAGEVLFVGNYFIETKGVTPYLSGDAGVGFTNRDGGKDEPTVLGPVVGVGAGLQLLRFRPITVDLGARAGAMIHSNGYGLPMTVSLLLGMYF
jgi:hypothetical protein